MLTQFVKKSASGLLEFILWVNLIGCIIGGSYLSFAFIYPLIEGRALEAAVTSVVIGIIIGVLSWTILSINSCFIAFAIDNHKNTKKITSLLEEIKKQQSEKPS